MKDQPKDSAALERLRLWVELINCVLVMTSAWPEEERRKAQEKHNDILLELRNRPHGRDVAVRLDVSATDDDLQRWGSVVEDVSGGTGPSAIERITTLGPIEVREILLASESVDCLIHHGGHKDMIDELEAECVETPNLMARRVWSVERAGLPPTLVSNAEDLVDALNEEPEIIEAPIHLLDLLADIRHGAGEETTNTAMAKGFDRDDLRSLHDRRWIEPPWSGSARDYPGQNVVDDLPLGLTAFGEKVLTAFDESVSSGAEIARLDLKSVSSRA